MTYRSSLPTRRGTAAVAVDEAALPSGGHSAFEEQTRGDKSAARAQLEKDLQAQIDAHTAEKRALKKDLETTKQAHDEHAEERERLEKYVEKLKDLDQ